MGRVVFGLLLGSVIACEASRSTSIDADGSALEAPNAADTPPREQQQAPPSNITGYREPKTSFVPVEVDDIPPPTNELNEPLVWDPRPTLKLRTGESQRDLAARIIESPVLRKLLGTRPGIDEFQSDNTAYSGGIDFRHFVRWRGQLIPTYRTVWVVLGENVLWHIRTADRATQIELPQHPPIGAAAALAKLGAVKVRKLGLEVVKQAQPKLVYTFGGQYPQPFYHVDAFTGAISEQPTVILFER